LKNGNDETKTAENSHQQEENVADYSDENILHFHAFKPKSINSQDCLWRGLVFVVSKADHDQMSVKADSCNLQAHVFRL
jgi:hypothetical protein